MTETAAENDRRTPTWMLAAVAALVVALVGSLVGMFFLNQARAEQQDLADAGRDAQVAAEAAVVQMTTYDYRTVESDFDWVDSAGTDSFQENFQDASEDAVTLITELQASARGTVIDSAATVTDPTHVTVLLFVDQEITSIGEDASKVDQPRVSMEMVRQGGKWLVDEVTLNNLIEPDAS